MKLITIAPVIVTLALLLGRESATAATEGKPGKEAVARPDAKKGISNPVLVNKVEPVYPEACRAEKVSGRVILEATIDRTGKVVDTRVLEGKDERLNAAATTAVRQWKYEAAHDSKGKPVPVLFTVTVVFRLD
jgi:TonB family protein